MSRSTCDKERRRVLLSLAACSAGAVLGQPALAASPEQAWRSSFQAFDGPFRTGADGLLACEHPVVSGKIPQELSGCLYRNGPARMRFGTTACSHWFDGDGMLQAFRFGDGKVSHQGAVLRTPKLVSEEAAGRFIHSAFGSEIVGSQPIRSPDEINVANINVLALNQGRDLYALWEAGSAVQVDAKTLQVQGFKSWSPETTGAPFSAHPRVAPDGTVWNFGYMPGSGRLIVYDIAPDGTLRRQTVIKAPQADMVHDFAITENYLVFLLMPLLFDARQSASHALLAHYRWQASAPMIVLTVDKRDFSTRRFELPNGGVFHLGNAWETGNTLQFGYARHVNLLEGMKRMQPDYPQEPPVAERSHWMQVELNLASGHARQTATDYGNVEFPRWDQRYTGQHTDFTLMMQRTSSMPEEVFGSNTVLTVHAGRQRRYDYGKEWIAEEHLFVPRKGATQEGGGWIMGTAYHWPTEKTHLSLFDAADVSVGPLASIALPYALPLGLHGQFVEG